MEVFSLDSGAADKTVFYKATSTAAGLASVESIMILLAQVQHCDIVVLIK